jgi:hypothetical protein
MTGFFTSKYIYLSSQSKRFPWHKRNAGLHQFHPIIAISAIAALTPLSQVSASQNEAYIKKAAFELTVAYQCEKVLNDKEVYKTAKRNAVKLMGESEAAKLITSVETHPRGGHTKDKGFCRMMTKEIR